ncbi:MAG: TetR/AcrR family transcriptional regulator, partial [Burkholderiaceae bacterium]
MNAERGRPRNFDENAVLDSALEVFWGHGFQGASLAELTEAMGLSKPSLYAAFGDKESLYLKALARYADVQIAKHAA